MDGIALLAAADGALGVGPVEGFFRVAGSFACLINFVACDKNFP